jgi:autotransporter-associated beta strand protein
MLALTNGVADFSQVIKSLSGGGTVNLGTAAEADTIAIPGTRLSTGSTADTTYFGVMAGAGGLVKQGTGTFALSGLNTYVGTTTVSVGNLQVGIAGAGQSGTGQTVVNAGATLSGTGFVQGATTINGLLSAGDTAGAGIGKLAFTNLSPGSLTISGGGTTAAPRVRMTLAGSTGNEADPVDGIQTVGFLNGAYGNHDHLQVQGGLSLTSGSTFVVELASGYAPTWGDVFNLIDWGIVTGTIVPGTFDTDVDLDVEVSASMLANGWFWEKDQFLTAGIIYVVPEPGRAVLLLLAAFLTVMRRRRV